MALGVEEGGGRPARTLASVRLAEIESLAAHRIESHIGELDRVLGGGFVPGGVVLLAGEPGIGKSTLTLWAAAQIAGADQPVLYVAAEESAAQIRLRAERLGLTSANIQVLASTDVGDILGSIEAIRPRAAVVDSIQAVAVAEIDSPTGSVSQVRESAARMQRLANATGMPLLLVGHVTKTGTVAGPRVLEHMVDVVLVLEGDRYHVHRLLRSMKNRFGATEELGVFEMGSHGLREVPDPSATFLAERAIGAPGSAVTVAMEGSRPLLCEVQALLGERAVENPLRSANGADYRRLVTITAVLAHRTGRNVAGRDVFVNVVGGLRVYEPAADLAIAAAIASSIANRPLPGDTIILGEIGLSGELRSVSHLERRLLEGAKLGFCRAVVPTQRGAKAPSIEGLHVHQAGRVAGALGFLLQGGEPTPG